MNKANLKKDIRKCEKDMDYRIDFYCGNTLTGCIFGGNELDCGFYIEPKFDKTYAIYFNYDQNVAIFFDRYELRSL